MAKKEYLQRYILIVELLRRKSVSFLEIQEYLFDNEIDISQRTFQRDKEEIESLWGIEIKFNKKDGNYEIKEELSDGKFDRIAESFTIANALNQSETFSKYIFLEQREPKGTEYFNGILHAIQNNLIITFQLNSYWAEATQRRCVPKAIKEAQNRWYLIGYDLDRKDFRNYGLDRISNFEITASKNATPNINVQEYYKNAFGIETQGQPYKVILKLDNAQKKYLQSLPLHHSQKIVEEKENYFIIELFLHLNFDFRMEILKLGSLCEVLEPKQLRAEIKEVINRMYKVYK
jgi:predicted DNA-binding transcriptional regulator YafY